MTSRLHSSISRTTRSSFAASSRCSRDQKTLLRNLRSSRQSCNDHWRVTRHAYHLSVTFHSVSTIENISNKNWNHAVWIMILYLVVDGVIDNLIDSLNWQKKTWFCRNMKVICILSVLALAVESLGMMSQRNGLLQPSTRAHHLTPKLLTPILRAKSRSCSLFSFSFVLVLNHFLHSVQLQNLLLLLKSRPLSWNWAKNNSTKSNLATRNYLSTYLTTYRQ